MHRFQWLLLLALFIHPSPIQAQNSAPRKIAFTFDDGDTSSFPGYPLAVWNEQLLNNLHQAGIKAIFYSTGTNKSNPKGQYVLQSWDDQGHFIANHSFSHKNYCNPNHTFSWFKEDFLRNDSLIRPFKNFIPYFRFPYLKEGETREKIDAARQLFKETGYQNGHVTIDASDWYVNSRLLEKLRKDPAAQLENYQAFYIEHLYDRAMFYDSLAYALTSRHISHTMLLHHNLAASLFLDDLIDYFKSKGWEIIDADQALNDPIYQYQSPVVPSGESIIWAMAKASGQFEPVLRYPAEDSRYEKARMDKLGL